jgi:hypothetical protein
MTERDVEVRAFTLAPELRSGGSTVGGYATPFLIRSQPLAMGSF